ncbi:MAG TPA: acyltransferase [Vineibacter sp.]|nr:acyltransferase [Vineibacter sp.]
MKTSGQGRFDIVKLREIAGDKVFARGKDYHSAGDVAILRLDAGRVVAQVAGTDDYRTVVTGSGEKIGGECSCPAFRDWGFCKHMVATALAANDAPAAPDGAADGGDELTRIRGHLKAKGVDALVAMIIDLADHDPNLFRKLDLAAVKIGEDAKTIESRLRRAIDEATRIRRFLDYGAVGSWAAGVETTLDAIADIAAGERAGLAVTLAMHAIDRIEQAIDSLDDSDGHCGSLLERAEEIHLSACQAARPNPVALARDLFTREMADHYGAFHGAAARYADVLGETGLAEYRRLAIAAWEELPPLVADKGRPTFSGEHHRLISILDVFAERAGDVDARIALRAKHLSSPWNYLQLAEFCLGQGRADEALRRAEDGLWMFEDQPLDQRLVFLAADLLAKAGRKDEGQAHLRRAFDKAPTLELYQRMRKLGGKAARDHALAFLEARLAREPRDRWHNPADLLVDVLMHEKLHDVAWTAARQHKASLDVRLSLARATETTHATAAVEVYAERVEMRVVGGGYTEAVELIARMARLRPAAAQAAYVAALKERHRRKRNLMKLLG